MKSEKFIIGLGNPGKIYKNSRHNLGFLFIEEIANKYSLKVTKKNKILCNYYEYCRNDINFRLFMPNTFMNNSGYSVRAIIDWYKIKPENLFIIVDDIDLPFGKIRCRKKGGSGGHNGLKSIITELKTKEFKRIRIGIGAPPNINNEKRHNAVSHVLGNFSKKEKLILDDIYRKIIESIEKWDKINEEIIITQLNSFSNNVKDEI
tara:strand:- start:1755 stop:2369 length:615 start_codon:yes stop_codon:yes gene_type:complete